MNTRSCAGHNCLMRLPVQLVRAVLTALLLVSPMTVPRARAGSAWRVGVIPAGERTSEPDHLIREKRKDRLIERISPRDLKARLKNFSGVIITGREGFWEDWLGPLTGFVERGGCLVLCGKAGWFVDKNRNGRYDPRIDRRPVADIDSLAGSTVEISGFRGERMRVFEDNPFCYGFHVGRWIPYPECKGKYGSMVKLSPGAAAVLAGVQLTRAKKSAANAPPEAGFYDAFYSGEAPYLTVCSRGGGLVVRVAENVLSRRRDSGMFEALVGNLLSEECWRRARSNYKDYGSSQPQYDGGNMVENGHMERVFLVRKKSPRKDNQIQELPYCMPVAWGYNAHGAVFQGTARRRNEGGYCLFMKRVASDESRLLGRVLFYQFRPMSRLENGKRYEIALAVKTQAVERARVDINYRLVSGEKKSLRFELPGGTRSWEKVRFRFQLPRYVPPGEEPARGFVLYIMMDGDGKMWVDDVYLRTVKPAGS